MLTPLEMATHVVLGRETGSAQALDASRPRAPVAAFEHELMRALHRPPCLVGFSGGRDSSAVLAMAARVARKTGLPLPVPVTLRFPAAPDALEDEWQERVIAHLGLDEWVRLSLDEEADLVGPAAAALMGRHGLPYPYNLHLVAPMVAAARGGAFVSGLGGDETLSPGSHVLAVLARHVRPSPRDVLRLAFEVAPTRVRARMLERRQPLRFPWLRDEANCRLARAWSVDVAARPLRRDRALRAWWTERYLQLTVRSLERLGDEESVEVHHPFASASFVAALAHAGGATGFPSRDAAMHALFGDVLPVAVTRRATKASFNTVLWNRHTKAFVAALRPDELSDALTGAGVDEIVDAEALHVHWSGPAPSANSFLLLQACWLARKS